MTEVSYGRAFTWETRTLGMRVAGSHEVAGTAGARATLAVDIGGPLAPLLGWIVVRVSRRFVPQEAAALKRESERG